MLPLLLLGSATAAIPGDTDLPPQETITIPIPPTAPPPAEPPEPVTVILPAFPGETAPRTPPAAPVAPPPPPASVPPPPASVPPPAPPTPPASAPKPASPPRRDAAPEKAATEAADTVVRAPKQDPAVRAAADEAAGVSLTVTRLVLALRARGARFWKTAQETPKQASSEAKTQAEARAVGSFVPPVPRREPLAAAVPEDRVPTAPLVAMLAATLILLAALTPAGLLARTGLPASDRLRGITMGVGLAGLIVGLGLLLMSS